jgi:hypothetical protein
MTHTIHLHCMLNVIFSKLHPSSHNLWTFFAPTHQRGTNHTQTTSIFSTQLWTRQHGLKESNKRTNSHNKLQSSCVLFYTTHAPFSISQPETFIFPAPSRCPLRQAPTSPLLMTWTPCLSLILWSLWSAPSSCTHLITHRRAFSDTGFPTLAMRNPEVHRSWP